MKAGMRMGSEKRRHTPEFKAEVALEAIKGKFTTAELAERYSIHPSLIHSWKKMVLDNAASLMEPSKHADPVEEETKDKEKQIEKLEQENKWLQKVLLRLPPSERKAAVETDNPDLPLLRQVKLLEINRSSIYYRKRDSAKHPGMQNAPDESADRRDFPENHPHSPSANPDS